METRISPDGGLLPILGIKTEETETEASREPAEIVSVSDLLPVSRIKTEKDEISPVGSPLPASRIKTEVAEMTPIAGPKEAEVSPVGGLLPVSGIKTEGAEVAPVVGLLPVSGIKTEVTSDDDDIDRNFEAVQTGDSSFHKTIEATCFVDYDTGEAFEAVQTEDSSFHKTVERTPTCLRSGYPRSAAEDDLTCIYMPGDNTTSNNTLAVQPNFIVENAFVSCAQLPPLETNNSDLTADDNGQGAAQSSRQHLRPDHLSTVSPKRPKLSLGESEGIPRMKCEPNNDEAYKRRQLFGGSGHGLLNVETNLVLSQNTFEGADNPNRIECVQDSKLGHTTGKLDKSTEWRLRFSKNRLSRDLARVNGTEASGKPYACDVCPKRFSHPSTLVTHKKSHSDVKPLQCSFCPKRFYRKTDLVSHERTHTGERPYACIYCAKRFAKSSYLPVHLRTHTGEKPHGCKLCGKRFSSKCDLITHERSHTGEKPFTCPVCARGFSKSCNLKRHVLTHKDEETESPQ